MFAEKKPGEPSGSNVILLHVILETNWLCLHEAKSESRNIPNVCCFCEK